MKQQLSLIKEDFLVAINRVFVILKRDDLVGGNLKDYRISSKAIAISINDQT